jgi:hypothetical protein
MRLIRSLSARWSRLIEGRYGFGLENEVNVCKEWKKTGNHARYIHASYIFCNGFYDDEYSCESSFVFVDTSPSLRWLT